MVRPVNVARKTGDKNQDRQPITNNDGGAKRRKSSKPKKKAAPRDTQLLQKVRLIDTKPYAIPRAAFCRVVKEILTECSPVGQPYRIQSSALEALQMSSEAYMVQLFEDMVLAQRHAKRVTLMYNDFRLVSQLRASFGDNIMMQITKKPPNV